MRVLLADDVADIRAIIRTNLELDDRFQVVGEAGDGRQAVQLAGDLQPDAVVLDVAMPVMDGLEAIPRIKKVAPESCILILSGFDARVQQEALRLGANGFKDKSSNLLALGDELHEVCGCGART